MTRMLVVASPTLDVLSTDGPMPTDGQPEHRHLKRKADCLDDHGDARTRIPHDHTAAWVSDGPYPFRVVVWQEGDLNCPECNGTRTIRLGTEELGEDVSCIRCDYHGAVVATVEVTGPSHHADDCAHDAPGRIHGFPQGRAREVERRYCHPDALPDCWHTPTGQVSRLDKPIPMDRPSLTPTAFGPTAIRSTRPLTERSEPAPWWWADIDLEVPA